MTRRGRGAAAIGWIAVSAVGSTFAVAAPPPSSSASPPVPSSAPSSSAPVPAAVSAALTVPSAVPPVASAGLTSADLSAPAASFLNPPTGTAVEIDADKPRVAVYVAPGLVRDTEPRYPDPFVKIGRTPVTVKLAPGMYTVTAESPEISVGSTVLQVGTEPVHMRIKGGSANSRSLGTLLLAIGAAGVLGAIGVEVSYSTAPSGFSKSKVAVPLFIVGGLGIGSGLAIFLSSGTTLEHDAVPKNSKVTFVGVASRW